MKRLIRLSGLLVLFLLSCQTALAPAAPRDVLPVDPAVLIGVLPNGLRYYIRANKKPEKRVEMRLVVNAGSLVEDEDQRGVAHMLEHLAFDGTLHFKKNELQGALEAMGMRFGDELNASTGYDQTVYRLQVPSDNPQGLSTGLLILEDWARHLVLDPAEVEKERRVIEEEWRTGRDAAKRISEAHMQALLKGSRYAEREPIGLMEVVRKVTPETIRKFYDDWYRPDLMAVIVVGDVDPGAVEQAVRERFGGMRGPASPRPRPVFTVPAAAAPAAAVAADKEATASALRLYFKRPARDLITESDYRRQLVEYVFHSLLSSRLAEIARKPDAPFLDAFSGQGRIVRTVEASVLGARAKEGMIDRSLEAVLIELERARRFGFTATELAREKENLLSGMEQSFQERDKRDSGALVQEYIRNFLENESSPGIEYEYGLYQRFVPGIGLEEVNAQALALFPERDRVLLVSLPERAGVPRPEERALLALFDKAKASALEPYRDRSSDAPLVALPPAPGAVVKEETIQELGVTVWTLSNGARVTLKPTDFKNDEIVLRAVSPGGESLAGDADFIPALTAAGLVSLSGVGSFSRVELDKKLAGVQAAVAPRIDDVSEGLAGSARPKDLPTMLQLVHLYFTQAKIDAEAFAAFKANAREAVAQRLASPENVYSDAIQALLTQNHLRFRPLTLADIEKFDADASLRFYRERFADASGFNFVLVGNIDLKAIRPLVETWLGGLPSSGRKEGWRDTGMRRPQGVAVKDVRMGKDPKSAAAIVFHGDFTWNLKEVTSLAVLAEAADIRLNAKIREEKGGTYSLSAFGYSQRIPRPGFLFFIEFGADPARVASLTRDIFAELDKMKTKGLTAVETAKAKEILLKEREANLKTNGFWAEVLKNYFIFGEDQRLILEYARVLQALTPADLEQAARRYWPTERYVKVTLYPEAAP